MIDRVVKFFNVIHIAMVYLAKLLLVGMVVIISITVFMRYVLNTGVHWSEEIALVFVVWFSFISMAIGVKQGLHISINILPPTVHPSFNAAMKKLRDIVVIVVGILMLIYGIILVQFTMRSIMPATKLPSGILYMVLPPAAVLMIYEGITDILNIDTKDAEVDRKLGGEELLDE